MLALCDMCFSDEYSLGYLFIILCFSLYFVIFGQHQLLLAGTGRQNCFLSIANNF